ncbi:MAG: leishmanolysin-related zinc metalloendopeptidase, partial [Actinomycetes bacterium]
GGILGGAGPCFYLLSDYLPRYGVMQFDVADLDQLLADGVLTDVITHEMGHVLGFGTMWDQGRSLISGAGTSASAYTGPLGVAGWSTLGGTGNVPLETGGGSGTADAHWSESRFGIELMTGYKNSIMRLSAMSIAAIADLGYQVNLSAADPYVLPTTLRAASEAAPQPFSNLQIPAPTPLGR